MEAANKPENKTENKSENKAEAPKKSNQKTCSILVFGCLGVMFIMFILSAVVAGVSQRHKEPETAKQEPVKQETAKRETVKPVSEPSPKQTEQAEQQGSGSPENVPIEFMRGAAKLTEKISYETQEGLLKSEILVSTKGQMVLSVWTEPMSLLESLDIADSVIIGYPIVGKKAGADWITGMPPVKKEEVTAANLQDIYKLFTEQEDYGNFYDPYEVLIMVYQQDGEKEALVYKKLKPKGERLKRVFAEEKEALERE